MHEKSSYENIRLRDRIRDLGSLATFIIVSLVVSIVIMDLIIFPISMLSVSNKELFNALVVFGTIGGVLGLFGLSLARSIMRQRKDGAPAGRILRSIIITPLKAVGGAFVFILMSLLIVYVVSLLMNGNYYLLYKLLNR